MITTDAVREFQAKERRAKEHLKRRLSCALAEDLNGLLQEELEADVSLYANSGSLRAHKAVLLARAPHLLQGQMHKDPIIIHLPGHELPSLKDFLRQVYTAHERTHSSGINPDAECWVPDSGLSPPDPAGPQSPRDSGAAPEPASGLGADLLDLYQMGEQCDITIQVAEQVFSCHRAILCARSQYFRAMLSGSWMESSRQCITLQGLGPDEMEILLHFIYGAIVDLPPGANSSQVVLAADMLGLDGLKDVVEMVLTRDYCRFFPKPVDGVQRTVLECLSLTHAVGLHNLYALCRRWVADHFVKTWCERNFSLLPLELQRACLTAVTDSMTVRNAVTTLCGSEQLMGSLPEVKWAQQVRSLSAELQEESLRLIVQHLPQVIRTQAFYDLCRREEFTREPALLKKLCSAIREGATVDNCCHLFAAVHRLCGDDAEDPLLDRRALQQEEPFRQEICSLRVRLWTFLLQSFYAVRHTQGWESLSAKHQERILADAIDKGDSRRLGKKPVFSSSQPKTVKCPLAAPESPVVQRTKRHSENTAAAMKSDAPGAASKPGDASKAKNVKKPGERSSAPKAKAAAPVVNGTAAAAATVSGGARREVASANGPRKEHNRKPGNPGARPRTSPPSCTPASATRVHKGALTKGDSTQAQASASSTSGSASPENGACSPRKDSQHSVPGAKPKLQTKLVSKATATKPAQKTEAAKSSSPSSKPNVKEGAKVKAAAAEKMATGARVDARGRGTPEHQVSKQASAARKTASPRKEDSRDGSRTPAAADKAASEPTKKKAVKPSSLSGAAAAAKSSAKPAKASLAASKQSSAAAAKSGAKPKSTSEASLEKAPSKSGAASKAPAATVAPAKRAATREKHSADGKSERGPDGDGAAAPDGGPEAAEHTGPPPEPNPESQAHSQRVSRNAAVNGTVPPAGAAEQIIAQPPLDGPPPAVAAASPADTPCSLGSASAEDSWGAGTQQQQRRPQRGSPGESESGSTHTTSSDDDIKPRSEDYDAGGSQDDDGSNDRGVSKCGTMRCHDFLGRSSSDTSTPEEFKMYEGSGGGGGGGGGLRVEVRLRGRDAETTSEEEVAAGRGRRPRSWLQRDEAPVEEEQSEVEATVTIRCVPDPQLFSSEEEDEEEDEDATEDERSEVEVIPRQAPPTLPTEPAPHFHGIVNLAFDDDAVDQENEQQQQQQQQTPDFQSTSNFRRSVLLSVDECEELGSEEGGAQTPPAQGEGSAAAPCDVFESSDCNHPQKQEHKVETEENSVFLTEVQVLAQGQAQPEEWGETTNHVAAEPRDEPPQERPCHLDLRHAERYNGGPCRNHSTKASDCKRVELHLDLAEPPLSADSAAAAALNAAQSPADPVDSCLDASTSSC